MADELWTVRRILNWTTGYLERKGDEHPRLSAEWLLGNACGLSRVEIYMNFDKPLSPAELDIMRDGVRRRGAGEPLQYVTGEMPFRHIVLRCEEGVLIPRPETEILVDAALEALDACGSDAPQLHKFEKRILCGPGSIVVAHTDQEHILLADIETAVDRYVTMVKTLL